MRIGDFFEHLTKKTKARKYLICRLLFRFNIKLCGDQGTPLEHLQEILRIIREVYKEK